MDSDSGATAAAARHPRQFTDLSGFFRSHPPTPSRRGSRDCERNTGKRLEIIEIFCEKFVLILEYPLALD
ncbi:hypothetical protein E2C01_059900 [Portunus trituberculatus]|uniref:Uncharacterized protein n=1 Tax=Portunus trituberculatus TaxID=210409 RepID=A0A5B7HAK1_PORTR|nr:hypothetical protein [Portunus trituberculatus]